MDGPSHARYCRPGRGQFFTMADPGGAAALLKNARKRMDILAAYREVGSFRGDLRYDAQDRAPGRGGARGGLRRAGPPPRKDRGHN
jgi:hypothetical protein